MHATGRVALFAAEFLPYSETFIYDQITSHRRYDIEVFTARRRYTDRFAFEPVHEGGLAFDALRWSPRFDRLFRSRRYDLIHAHFGPTAVCAMDYARRFSLPLVVTFHGHDVPVLGSFERFRPRYLRYALYARRMLSSMSLGLCASRELAELLMELGVPAARLHVLRLGVDLSRFDAPARPASVPDIVPNAVPQIVMIGRLVPKKGFAYGIRAFAQQVRDGRRARLTIIGSGPLDPALRGLVRELGIDDRVTFAGVLPPAEVAAHLARAHILMAPSVVAMGGDRESGVIAIKEACACRVVPIGTYHGGIPEIIDDGVTGFLVPERNVNALSHRLGMLLDDPDLRSRMAAAARAKMEREYDLVHQVAALESIYDHVRRWTRPEAPANPSGVAETVPRPPAAPARGAQD